MQDSDAVAIALHAQVMDLAFIDEHKHSRPASPNVNETGYEYPVVYPAPVQRTLMLVIALTAKLDPKFAEKE